jgi:hypothetical protein
MRDIFVKKVMRLFLVRIVFIVILFPCTVYSQVPDRHQVIEEIIEDLMDSNNPDVDPGIVYDELLFYLLYPLNINTAGADEFAGLHFMNGLQILNLIAYRRSHGEFKSIYELLYIDGFSPDDLRKMHPFLTVEVAAVTSGISPASVVRSGRHQAFIRLQGVLQEQKGYLPITDSMLARSPNSRYLGGNLKIYHRYQFDMGRRVAAGLVAEKDQGEEFFRGTNPGGFDYYSMHLQINDAGRFKTISLGDFQAGFGQGLVLWSGLDFSKSSNTLGIRKNARGIQKYSSTDENMFFRGAGITYRFSGTTEGSLFVSRKKIDAGISLTDAGGKILEVSSLQKTGLHATPSQMAGKKILGETIAGANITWNRELFRLGATVAALKYDAVLNPAERIYNQFEFMGDRNLNGGVDYQFSAGSVRFFGEGAISSSGGKAFLSGAMFNPGSKMSISSLYRNYTRDYHAYFSNGFRENTGTSNEEGFYLGTMLHPARRWKLSAYFDLFSFPWMRYRVYAPSSGVEYFLQLDFNYSRDLHMYLNFRHKDKPVNSPAGESNLRTLYDSGRSGLRYHVNYSVSSSIELRNRFELSEYTMEGISPERGILLYQDILFKPRELPFSLAFRMAVFETDGYNARFYAYENDVLYAFSIPAYYDSGYRTYLLAQYTSGNLIDIWLKYALTKLPGRESIGTGLNEINGDMRSELKVQVRMRF